MANLGRMGLARELLVRIGMITFIFMLVDLVVLRRHFSEPDKFYLDIPLLFAVYGTVIAINVMFSLRKYQVMGVK